MKYFAIFALVSLLPAALAFEKDPEFMARESGKMQKRACSATKCSCQNVPNGLFCGDGLLGCVKGHVYQCGGDGTKACDFGVRNSCAKCNDLFC